MKPTEHSEPTIRWSVIWLSLDRHTKKRLDRSGLKGTALGDREDARLFVQLHEALLRERWWRFMPVWFPLFVLPIVLLSSASTPVLSSRTPPWAIAVLGTGVLAWFISRRRSYDRRIHLLFAGVIAAGLLIVVTGGLVSGDLNLIIQHLRSDEVALAMWLVLGFGVPIYTRVQSARALTANRRVLESDPAR